jgi:putative transposase
MQASDAGKLRELESENAKQKKLLAEVHLDIHAPRSLLTVISLPLRTLAVSCH